MATAIKQQSDEKKTTGDGRWWWGSIKTHEQNKNTRSGHRMKERVSQEGRQSGRPVMIAEK
jgi:hypothetical protein